MTPQALVAESQNQIPEGKEIQENVLFPWEFQGVLMDSIEAAQSHVYLKAMLFDEQASMESVIGALEKSLEKNKENEEFRITIDIDDHTRFTEEGKTLFERLDTIQKKSAGKLKIQISNPTPGYLKGPFVRVGRDHRKVVKVDDTYFIGGMNFDSESFQSIDGMIKITDSEIVSALDDIFISNMYENNKENSTIVVNSDTTIYLDMGKIGDSKIIDEAVSMVDNAHKSVRLVTQFLPDERFAKALMAAQQRGVEVVVITNHTERMPGIYKLVDKFNKIFKRPNIAESKVNLIASKYFPIHGKVLMVDDCDVMFGSSNFTTLTEMLGTEEIIIKTKNIRIVEQYRAWFDRITSVYLSPEKRQLKEGPQKIEEA